MKWMIKVVCVICLGALLTGCGDRLSELKNAVSGINSAADSAASAVSRDVHAIRAISIHYNNNTFTINNLFKTILRDVRWEYDDEQDELRVAGTWQAPLFAEQAWDDAMQKQLAETGVVTINLKILDNTIDSTNTEITLSNNNEIILSMSGTDALHHLYDTYLQK